MIVGKRALTNQRIKRETIMTATRIEALEIGARIMGAQTSIYPTLIWDNKTMVLVDAGFPGQLSEIRRAIMKAAASFEKINKIIITHHDRDHIGSLRSILNELPQKASVLTHKEERPYIEGYILPCKVTVADAPDSPYPPEMKTMFLPQKLDYLDFTVSVDRTLEDGEELPFCGGITVIHTPGHTPGHICLYIGQSKTLIAGDALSVENKKLSTPPKLSSFDPSLAVRSLEKLVRYDIETAICYHGGVWRGSAGQFIAELAELQ
jgi:glyoxylase-like metal-dependent hydrolase (beta-lactamase superfamily II)